MQKLYAVEDFIELAKKVQGNIWWNPDWDCSTQQLKGWLKAKLGDGPYTVWAILEGVAAISGRPATYWEIKMANDFWENASATTEKEHSMKRTIKIGDWIRRPYWGEFFEVTFSNDAIITLRSNLTGEGYYNYDNDGNWIKKSEESTMKVELGKKYRKVGTHEPVRVICVDASGNFPVIYLQETANVSALAFLDSYGFNGCGTQVIEEVPAVDWSKVEVDTLIWVGNTLRYFSQYADGHVYFFRDGTTSKTNTNGVGWVYAKHCFLEEPK